MGYCACWGLKAVCMSGRSASLRTTCRKVQQLCCWFWSWVDFKTPGWKGKAIRTRDDVRGGQNICLHHPGSSGLWHTDGPYHLMSVWLEEKIHGTSEWCGKHWQTQRHKPTISGWFKNPRCLVGRSLDPMWPALVGNCDGLVEPWNYLLVMSRNGLNYPLVMGFIVI